MARRKATARFNSPEVQGEGSWVELRRLTVGEIRKIRRENKPSPDMNDEGNESAPDVFEVGVDVATSHIVNWNWADENGEPLPLPSADPGVMDELTDQELQFISDALIGNEAEQKNSPSGS